MCLMTKENSKLLGVGDAARFLKVSYQRLPILIKNYNIPYQETSSGKIFFERDLIAFRDSPERKRNLKYGRRKDK